jgi:hypothetical protein
MRRLYSSLAAVFLASTLGGCGENQPNSPAKPEDQSPDFGRQTGDMMKSANSGMDPKKLKSSPGSLMPPMKTKR